MNDEPTKFYFRQRQQNRLYDIVIHAIEDSADRTKMRRKDIAKAIGIPSSQVTRLLSGPANWTVDTVSDLLFAINAELDFQVVNFRDRSKGNRAHPAGEGPTTASRTVKTGTTSSGAVSAVDLLTGRPTPGGGGWVMPPGEWPRG